MARKLRTMGVPNRNNLPHDVVQERPCLPILPDRTDRTSYSGSGFRPCDDPVLFEAVFPW